LKGLIELIGFGSAAGMAQTKMNKDFDRKELKNGHVDSTFHKLNDKMKHKTTSPMPLIRSTLLILYQWKILHRPLLNTTVFPPRPLITPIVPQPRRIPISCQLTLT
jgi:hypothetical protein